MAKKTLSFAEKAAKKKNKSDIKYVKYVGSVRSEKTGNWRFNERMIGLEGGESLDAALKRIDEQKKLLNIELPDPEQPQVETEKIENSVQVESATIKEVEEPVEVSEAKDPVGVEGADSSESAETNENIIEKVEDTLAETKESSEGESTEEASEAEGSLGTEAAVSSETERDSGIAIDKEPGEADLGENQTLKNNDAPKEGSSEKKQKE